MAKAEERERERERERGSKIIISLMIRSMGEMMNMSWLRGRREEGKKERHAKEYVQNVISQNLFFNFIPTVLIRSKLK